MACSRPSGPRQPRDPTDDLAIGLSPTRQVEELAVERPNRALDQDGELARQLLLLQASHGSVHGSLILQVRAVQVEFETVRKRWAETISQLGGDRAGFQQEARHRRIIDNHQETTDDRCQEVDCVLGRRSRACGSASRPRK